MVIELLVFSDHQLRQQPRHDLESFLYVIFYICTFTCGPSVCRPQREIPEKDTMRAWFTNDQLSSIGWLKAGHMSAPEATIIPHFSGYWGDFAPFVVEL